MTEELKENLFLVLTFLHHYFHAVSLCLSFNLPSPL